MGVSNWQFALAIASRYTAKSITLDQIIFQTIGDMESTTWSKIIQNDIMNKIGLLKFFSVWFEKKYFCLHGGKFTEMKAIFYNFWDGIFLGMIYKTM